MAHNAALPILTADEQDRLDGATSPVPMAITTWQSLSRRQFQQLLLATRFPDAEVIQLAPDPILVKPEIDSPGFASNAGPIGPCDVAR
jgi:hypothetical protein